MYLLNEAALRPLPTDCGRRYRSMASDGLYFYFVLCQDRECCIRKYNVQLECVGSVPCCRGYTSLSYDPRENCFWAACYDICGRIFKVDLCGHEIDSVSLECTEFSCRFLSGVSVDSVTNTLLVAYPDAVIEYNKSGGFVRLLNRNCRGRIYTGISSISPYRVVTFRHQSTQHLQVQDDSGQVLQENQYPCNERIEGAVWNSACGGLFALVTRNRMYSYLLRVPVETAIAAGNVAVHFNGCGCSGFVHDNCCCSDGGQASLLQNAVTCLMNLVDRAMCQAKQSDGCGCATAQAEQIIHNVLDRLASIEDELYCRLDELQALQNGCECDTAEQDDG